MLSPEERRGNAPKKNKASQPGALRPQTPHRSPWQAFGGTINQLVKLHYNEKRILVSAEPT
jgi:hypothetical protein